MAPKKSSSATADAEQEHHHEPPPKAMLDDVAKGIRNTLGFGKPGGVTIRWTNLTIEQQHRLCDLATGGMLWDDEVLDLVWIASGRSWTS